MAVEGIAFFLCSNRHQSAAVVCFVVQIVAVYVLSTVVGGIVIGKLVRTRRFFWGLLLGNLYFILLLVITIILYRSLSGNGLNMLTAWILCTGGGMTGGMIS